jgi:hypothetical protein
MSDEPIVLADRVRRAPRQGQVPVPLTQATWTLTQAAEICQVSRRTIVRRLPQLKEHGAHQDDQRQWHVTANALRAVGLEPGIPAAPDRVIPRGTATSTTTHATPDDTEATGLPLEVVEKLAKADEYRRRAEVAEARLEERGQVVAALQMALRQLEARTTDRGDDVAVHRDDAVARRLADVDDHHATVVEPAATAAPTDSLDTSDTAEANAPAKVSRVPKWLRRKSRG